MVAWTPVFAGEPAADLASPKPTSNQNLRVLLHIPGSARLLDYPEVCRVHTCDKDQITFETHDGYIVTHRGSFTVIQHRNTVPSGQNPLSPGPRYYEPK